MMFSTFAKVAAVAVVSVAAAGCSTWDGMSSRQKGAVTGAGVGGDPCVGSTDLPRAEPAVASRGAGAGSAQGRSESAGRFADRADRAGFHRTERGVSRYRGSGGWQQLHPAVRPGARAPRRRVDEQRGMGWHPRRPALLQPGGRAVYRCGRRVGRCTGRRRRGCAAGLW